MTMAKPKLTKKERAALTAVRDLLDGGLLEYQRDVSGFSRWSLDAVYRIRRFFNMSVAIGEADCGTVGCIGGWMAANMGLTPSQAQAYVYGFEGRGKFNELFFPSVDNDTSYAKITPRQAVKAIDNFLKTGNPRWASIGVK